MIVCTLLEPGIDELAGAIQEFDSATDVFEVRLDALRAPVDPVKVRALTAKPLIATMRRTTDGGLFSGDEHERLARLEACLAAGFEYADVEGPTTLPAAEERIIRSRHEPRATPSAATIVRLCREMNRNGALAKFAAPTNSFADLLTILAASRELAKEPGRFALMGLGAFPRALLHVTGSSLVYGGGRTNAPGQPSAKSIHETLAHWGQPSAAPSLYLVVGNPVDQSLSPRMHNVAFQANHVAATYGALQVPTGLELQMLLGAAARIGLQGLSVTTPLKDAAFGLCERRTPEADAAQAVNCIRFDAEGPLGHNTDGLGARQIIDDLVPQAKGQILLAGTGGAARAIASQLHGLEFTIAGRREQNLRPLASRYACRSEPLAVASSHLQEFDLLINATGVLEPFPIQGYRGALFDLHYRPDPTPWEDYAKTAELPAAGGRTLLLEQGVAAFEFWTRQEAPVEAMRHALEGHT